MGRFFSGKSGSSRPLPSPPRGVLESAGSDCTCPSLTALSDGMLVARNRPWRKHSCRGTSECYILELFFETRL